MLARDDISQVSVADRKPTGCRLLDQLCPTNFLSFATDEVTKDAIQVVFDRSTGMVIWSM